MFLKRKAYYLIIGLFCVFINSSVAQDQRVADSLKIIYDQDVLKDSAKLELLSQITFNELNDFNLSLKYAEELIDLSKSAKNDKYLFDGYYASGNTYKSIGELDIALTKFFSSVKIANKINHPEREGIAYMAIADVYSIMGDFTNSENYYSKAIAKLRQKAKYSNLLAAALLNAGDDAFLNNQFDKALGYFEEAGIIYERIDSKIGMAYNLGNIGMVYAKQGEDNLAEQNINEAIVILEEIKDYAPVSVYLNYMSDIYAKKQDWPQAFSYAERSLDLAMQYGLKDQISKAYLQISELNELRGMAEESLKNYKNHIVYRDSVTNISSIQAMANQRTNYEVSQKQIEVDLLDQQRKNQQLISLASGISLLLIIVVAIGLYRRNNFINKAKLLVENEKKRSDLLLLNILPEQTAEELKDNGKVQAKRFDSVSVMFTDFQGFTAYSDKLSPEELVDSIDFYYSKFDDIIEKHGLEKIKTVGDAYMCAGGLPFPTEDHPGKMIEAALEIAEFVHESKKIDPEAMTRFDIRIGINTGPVVAGIVGKKKFAYDIWGDTVNIASRMESNSEPGKINISDNTYQLIKDQYECTYRGEIEAKNKGMMKMYFVKRLLM
ncbi:adenylate/guanylate cyclase domain-containing protein [Lutimonas vermicola]|uniref:Adenylate/guanylate cyclase domain-containing protein n=1 Tax=Lutimonas vermicola TaxID=414288 RepID=A0ABU9KXE5_9FLAO